MLKNIQRLVVLACAAWLGSPASALAATWFVATNGDDVVHNGTGGWDQAYATILKAINGSTAGAVILVSNGTYVLSGSSLSVGDRSILGFSGNPVDTIVNGGGAMRCFLLNHSNSFVAGLTITNGMASEANVGGGGAYISAGGVISNCWIVGNLGSSTSGPNVHGGGGVLISGTGGQLLNCLIAGNVSSNDGGGLMARMPSGPVLVQDCVISNNSAVRYGGGIDFYGSAFCCTAVCCDVVNNQANVAGGVYNGIGLVDRCRVLNNGAVQYGGGIYMYTTLGFARNCLIAGNAVTAGVNVNHGGGGVQISNVGRLDNCTIVSNTANINAGGIVYYCQAPNDTYRANVTNSIVYFNTVNGNPSNWYAAMATYKTNIIYNHSCLTPTNGLSPASADNIDADPLFVDPDNGNYRLSSGSPCVNAGAPQDWMKGAGDLDAHPRLDRFTGLVDMGCYEYIYHGTLFSVR